MVTNLKLQGSVSGQEIGNPKNKKTDLPQNLDLINLIQEALGQGVAAKKGHFSDVLGSLKQTQLELNISSKQIVPQKNHTTSSPKFRPEKTVDSSSIAPKKEKIKESNSFKEQSLEKTAANTEVVKKPTVQKTENLQNKNEPASNIKNALEYDLISIINSQEKTISPEINYSNLALITGTLQKLETTTETQNFQEMQPNSQLKSQINQWVNEGKVQIQKMQAPLEMGRPTITNLEMTREETSPKGKREEETVPGGRMEQKIKAESFNKQVMGTSLKLDTPLKQETTPLLDHALNQTKTNPQLHPIRENNLPKQSQDFNLTQTKAPLSQEIQVPSNKMAEDQKVTPTAINTPNTNHVVPPQPISMAPKTTATDNSTTNKATTIEEVGGPKSAPGQNKITPNSLEKNNGKMLTNTKTLTMTEKIQALQQVKSQMKVALQKGETHLLVKLTPDDLGKVDIRLDISREGNVSALFKAENRETMILLSKYADDFRQIFGESGLNSDMSGMNFSSSDQQASQFDQIPKALGKNVPLIGKEEEIMSLSEISKDFPMGMSRDQRLNITV